MIRRLRATAEGSTRGGPEEIIEPVVGSAVPALELTDVGGAVVHTVELVRGPALIAFVAAGCTPCHEQLPALRAEVQSRLACGERALVVVLAPDRTAVEFTETFAGLAPVVLEGDDAAVSTAFAVDGYPTYVECAAGLVRGVGATVAGMRDLARA